MTKFTNFVLQAICLAVVALLLMIQVYKDDSPFAKKGHGHIVLNKNNLIVLDGEINQSSVARVQSEARALKGCPIYLYLDSPGGYIAYGLEMIDMLKGLPCPVKTITRYAASMAFETVQNLDERLIFANGVLMAHHPSGSFSGEFGGKQPSQIDHKLFLSVRQWSELDEITVARTKGKQTLKSYQEAYDHELWLTAQQAIEGGYADRIVTVECDSSLNGGVEINGQSSSEVILEKSYCPLISGPIARPRPTPLVKKDPNAIDPL